MEMTSEEKRIEQAALEYAKKHRTEIARRLTDPTIFVPEANPVSVFMAGSPRWRPSSPRPATSNRGDSAGMKLPGRGYPGRLLQAGSPRSRG